MLSDFSEFGQRTRLVLGEFAQRTLSCFGSELCLVLGSRATESVPRLNKSVYLHTSRLWRPRLRAPLWPIFILMVWVPKMILVIAQKLVHTVEDHTSHHETFLSSVPPCITGAQMCSSMSSQINKTKNRWSIFARTFTVAAAAVAFLGGTFTSCENSSMRINNSFCTCIIARYW